MELQPLTKFPADFAASLSELTWAAAWYPSNAFRQYHNDAKKDLARFFSAQQDLKRLSQGLQLSKKAVAALLWLPWHAAWRTANERAGKRKDALAKANQVDKLYFALKESPELTQQLAGHVRDFALAAGWFTANTRWQKDKPEKDKQQASLHESQLGAPVYVTEVHFGEPQISISDPSKGVGLPITVFNPSKTEALEQVSKSYVTRLTSSVTKQWTGELGNRLEATVLSVPLGGEGKATPTLEAPYELILKGVDPEPECSEAQFTVKTAPWTCKTVQCVVSEVEATVPFTCTVEIDGVKREFTGAWQGLVCGPVTLAELDEHSLPQGDQPNREEIKAVHSKEGAKADAHRGP